LTYLPARSAITSVFILKKIEEVAEISNIAENAHRYLKISFAEDLYLYCQANNINFAELRDPKIVYP
jgi:UDP-N-acetyl-D-mannosaminuronate dehydrogenase